MIIQSLYLHYRRQDQNVIHIDANGILNDPITNNIPNNEVNNKMEFDIELAEKF